MVKINRDKKRSFFINFDYWLKKLNKIKLLESANLNLRT